MRFGMYPDCGGPFVKSKPTVTFLTLDLSVVQKHSELRNLKRNEHVSLDLKPTRKVPRLAHEMATRCGSLFVIDGNFLR